MYGQLFRDQSLRTMHRRLTRDPEARDWLQHRLRLLLSKPGVAQKVCGSLQTSVNRRTTATDGRAPPAAPALHGVPPAAATCTAKGAVPSGQDHTDHDHDQPEE